MFSCPVANAQRQTSTPLNEAKLHSTEPPIRPEICSMCNTSPALNWVGIWVAFVKTMWSVVQCCGEVLLPEGNQDLRVGITPVCGALASGQQS